MAGYLAQAFGSLFAGQFLVYAVSTLGYSEKYAITNLVRMYAGLGGLMCLGYYFMDNNIEA